MVQQREQKKGDEKQPYLFLFDTGDDGAGVTECFPGVYGKVMIADYGDVFQYFPVGGADSGGHERRNVIISAQTDAVV